MQSFLELYNFKLIFNLYNNHSYTLTLFGLKTGFFPSVQQNLKPSALEALILLYSTHSCSVLLPNK